MSHFNLRCDGFNKFFHDALALVSRKPRKVEARDMQEQLMEAEEMGREQERAGEDAGKCAICTWTGPIHLLDEQGLCPSCQSDRAVDITESHNDKP